MPQETKFIAKRRKFQEVEIPIIKSKIEVVDSVEDIKGKKIKLDLTRQLKGKSLEMIFNIDIEKKKAIANPIKIVLMPYFIRRMIRKNISYIEDSFLAKSQESILKVKPFLITRKRVSRSVRRALRNRAKNWLEDYLSQKTNNEIFSDIITNKLQKPLSLVLKKTYPLSLCEIRILEIQRILKPEEIPKKIKKTEIKEISIVDQLKEIEDEKIKEAELTIKETQKKAAELEKVKEIEEGKITKEEINE